MRYCIRVMFVNGYLSQRSSARGFSCAGLTSHQGLPATIETKLGSAGFVAKSSHGHTTKPRQFGFNARTAISTFDLAKGRPRSLFRLARSQIYPLDLILKERSWCPVKLIAVSALINREGMQQPRHTGSKAHKKCLGHSQEAVVNREHTGNQLLISCNP